MVAVDGKTMRRWFDTAAQQSPLQVVTVSACEQRLVVAQAAVNGKENEILAARTVLELFDIKGMMITADALRCNAKTTRLIPERDGDHPIALKVNRSAMHNDVRGLFAQPPSPPPSHVTVDNDHGRLETRRHEVWRDVAWLNPTRSVSDEARLPGLAMIGMIEMVIEQAGKTRCERRYFISSRQLSAEQFAKTARAHWKIENSLQWVLDVCFDEDCARNRRDHGPENLATLRKLAPNVLRSTKPDNLYQSP